MKTLLFCNLMPRKTGAYEALLAAIGREFRKAGDEYVVVFSGEPIPAVAESLRGAGIKWHVMIGWVDPEGRVRAWYFVHSALRIIRHERPDVVAVHFGNELPTLAASLLCRAMVWWSRLISSLTTRQLNNLTTQRIPQWVWEQDQRIQDPGRIGHRISKIRLLGLGMDRFMAVYEGGRQSMLKRGIPGSKITMIHNAVAPYAPARRKNWLREELGIVPHEVILVTNGSLIPRKRIEFILQVCAALRPAGVDGDCQVAKFSPAENVVGCQVAELLGNGPNGQPLTTQQPDNLATPTPSWCLLIIGDGPERQNLVGLAEELGVADHVHFLGLRNDVREILAESDIYLHAARAEACSYAIIESMAAGIPAVALNAGAAREQIEDGVSGYVFDGDAVEPFTACLLVVMNDPALRALMGWRAKSRWESLFHVEKAAGLYHAMYGDVGSCTSIAHRENAVV